MKITNIHIATLLLAGALLIGCDDFLDVEPKSQIKSSELAEDEAGLKSMLAGVYSSMIAGEYYGSTYGPYTKELRFGFIGVLGQEWDNYPSSSYSDAAVYDYTATLTEGYIATIWQSLYNSIANTNNLIKELDGREHECSGNNYAIIKGEAYALRAMLHFDLLRCFGKSYADNGAEWPAIPYVTELAKAQFPQLTVDSVMQHVLADLAIADTLLQVDPIKTGEEITELDDNGYLMNRQVHLNYYAVKALEARAYIWMGDYENAEACANEVINSGVFTWSTQSDMINGYDYCNAPEQVFALSYDLLDDLADTYFSEDNYSSGFCLTTETVNNLYSSTDYRYLYLFTTGTGQLFSYKFVNKYNATKSSDSYYADKMSVIKLSEMYLIQSECEYIRTGSGISGLNAIRNARSVARYVFDPDDYYDALVTEYKCETLSEGQMFFLYKRLNYDYIPGSGGISMYDTKGYVFPIPDSETDAAVRESNR